MITRILLISTSLLNILFTMSICLFITQPTFLNLIMNQDWPEDEDKCLLLSLSTFIGSLGYSSSVFYTSKSPLWDDILISMAVFFLLMMVSNLAMFVYSTYYFNSKYYPYVAWPWLVFSCPTMLLFFSILVFLMVDLNNTTRLTMELQSGGNGVFAKTLSILMEITLFQVLSILVVVIHLVREANQTPPKLPVRMLGGLYNGRTPPHAANTPARERRTTWGRDVSGPVRVEINDDSGEVELCGPAFTPSVVSFPGGGGIMVSHMESIEKKWKTSEELKCRAADNGMDMAVGLEREEPASDVDEEMEESEALVGREEPVVLQLLERTDVLEEVESTKPADGSELSNVFDILQKTDSSPGVENGNGERLLQIRKTADGLERVDDLTSICATLVGLDRMTSRVELDENEGEVLLSEPQPCKEEEPLGDQDSKVDIFEEDSYKKQVDAPLGNTENIVCEEEDTSKQDESASNRSVDVFFMPADRFVLLPDNFPDVSIGSGFD